MAIKSGSDSGIVTVIIARSQGMATKSGSDPGM